MKKHNRFTKALKMMLLSCLVMFPLSLVNIHAAEYEVVFKAGAHGSVNNDKRVTYTVQAGDIFPNEPNVVAEEGYVFTGWNKDLPAVGSQVEGKAVYVAQYDVVINGISYIVRYVDEQGVAIATAKTMMAESGSQVIERAKTIPGYTYQNAQQQFTLSESNKEISFVYTLTNPEERVTYVEETVNVTTPGTTTGTNQGTAVNPGTNQTTGTNNQTTDNPNTEIGDNTIPQGNGNNVVDDENIEEQEVPLAKNKSNMENILAISGVAGVLVFAVVVLLLVNRKKKAN